MNRATVTHIPESLLIPDHLWRFRPRRPASSRAGADLPGHQFKLAALARDTGAFAGQVEVGESGAVAGRLGRDVTGWTVGERVGIAWPRRTCCASSSGRSAPARRATRPGGQPLQSTSYPIL